MAVITYKPVKYYNAHNKHSDNADTQVIINEHLTFHFSKITY